MSIGKLIFHQVFMNADQKKRVVRLNHDSKRLVATVSQPEEGKPHNIGVCNVSISPYPVPFLVRLGVHQQFAVRIKTRDSAITNGLLVLESQTEGLEITKTDKVPAKLTTKDGDIKELELEMNDNKLILLPHCEAHEELELFVVYEGPYTEFDYRVKLKKRFCLGG
jgi:hypothetical protein